MSGPDLRVGLVACSKTKADQPTIARELYVSPLFRAARTHAEQSYDAWLILSAKHGAVRPTTVLAPYDFTLAWLAPAQRHAWAAHVVGQLIAIFGDLHRCAFGIHAGLAYRGPLCPYLPSWSAPLQGLGIGQQLAWYRRHLCGQHEGRCL